MEVGRGHTGEEFVERIARGFQGRNDEPAVLNGQIDLGAGVESGLCGERLGYTKGEAITPLLNSDAHRLLLWCLQRRYENASGETRV
jgi:hypothetical protein